MMLENIEINISRWDGLHEFYKPGIEKSYEMENFDEERFHSFCDRLIEHYPESFEEIEHQLERPRVSIATPKPEPMEFQETCHLCGKDLQNDKIHFEVQEDEGGLLFLCRYCLITLPKTKESLKKTRDRNGKKE